MFPVISNFLVCALITFGLLELILYLQKGATTFSKIRMFRVVTWVVGVGGILSPLLAIKISSSMEPSELFGNIFLVWVIVFNLYLFSRFFKNQACVND